MRIGEFPVELDNARNCSKLFYEKPKTSRRKTDDACDDETLRDLADATGMKTTINDGDKASWHNEILIGMRI